MSDIRERLLEATFHEIHEYGYHAASLSRILKKAEAKKGSMYHYFSSKKEMALVMIEEKLKARSEKYWLSLSTCKKDYLAFLISMLQDTKKHDFTKGCPLGNLLQQCSSGDEDFLFLLKEALSNMQKLFEGILQKACDAKEISNIDVKSTALFIISSLQGALLLSKQSASSYEFDICMQQVEVYLLNLAPASKKQC